MMNDPAEKKKVHGEFHATEAPDTAHFIGAALDRQRSHTGRPDAAP